MEQQQPGPTNDDDDGNEYKSKINKRTHTSQTREERNQKSSNGIESENDVWTNEEEENRNKKQPKHFYGNAMSPLVWSSLGSQFIYRIVETILDKT